MDLSDSHNQSETITNNLNKLAGALITISQQMVTQSSIGSARRREERAPNIDAEVESFM